MTQGLLSITQNGKTLIKIVCGCGGYNIQELMNTIIEKKLTSAEDIYNVALELEFGCEECLVVHEKGKGILIYKGDEFIGYIFYQKKFEDPYFNPRWKYGTADFTRIIQK